MQFPSGRVGFPAPTCAPGAASLRRDAPVRGRAWLGRCRLNRIADEDLACHIRILKPAILRFAVASHNGLTTIFPFF